MYRQCVIARSEATWQSHLKKRYKGVIMAYFVYMMTNKYGNVLYTGVTNDLIRRVYEHRNHLLKDSFSARY